MNIRFCNFYGDKREVDKTSYFPVSPLTISGTMRFPLDYLKPSIYIDFSALTSSQLTDFQNSNYCYIPQLQRYYYIVNKTFINDKICTITLVVDVLTSNKDDIKASTQFVERNENTYDLSIEDKLRQFTSMKETNEYEKTNVAGVTITTLKWENLEYNGVVCTYGGGAGAVASANFTSPVPNSDLPTVNNLVIGAQAKKNYLAVDYIGLAGVIDLSARESQKFGSFVQSAVVFPFEIGQGNVIPAEDILFPAGTNSGGNQDMWSIRYKVSDSNGTGTSGYKVIACWDFGAFGNDYLYYRPYTQYEIYLPFIGYKEINPFEISSKRLWIIYVANYDSGSAVCLLYTSDKTAVTFSPDKFRLIASYSCQMGRVVGVTTTNFDMNETLRQQNRVSFAISELGSIASIVGGVASENPIMIAGGVMGATKAVANYATSEMTIKDHANVAINGDIGNIFTPLKPRMREVKLVLADNTVDGWKQYTKEFGAPLYKAKTLSSLTGMTIISNPILYGFGCMQSEKDEIRKAMQTGIIL